MLVARCPRCGAPNPVCVATPEVYACRSCGYRGTPSPDVAQRLAQARQLLFGLDARHRQLGGIQRRLLRSARRSPWRVAGYFVGGLLLMAPCVGCALLFGLTPHPSYTLALSCGAPPLFLGVVGLGVVVVSFRRRRSLERACSATPPAVEGEPARCHVCGGPLPSGSLRSRGIVRCEYCQADNLVDPARLRAMGAQRHADLSRVEDAVRQEGRALHRESNVAVLAMLGVFGLAGMSFACVLAVGTAIVPYLESPLNEDLEYVLVETPRLGACFARVNGRDDDGAAYVIGPAGIDGTTGRVDLRGGPTLGPRWVVGRRVVVHPAGRREPYEGRVVDVHGSLLKPEDAVLRFEAHGGTPPRLRDACLARRPAGVRVFPSPAR
ncbi:MAG TPA: hypothetical protein RMH99_16410 [Sandaracinaceae bacterium LLY-WYZ-13_1]|nr:hypothetical protein [Sandaracinaceae bacterium LLY-WYZ-13_1]